MFSSDLSSVSLRNYYLGSLRFSISTGISILKGQFD